MPRQMLRFFTRLRIQDFTGTHALATLAYSSEFFLLRKL
jgi:hypothetical protein